MQVHSALSKADGTADALDEVCREATTRWGGRSVDLAFVFSPHDLAESADLIVSTVSERLRPKVLLGCSAESVIGDTQEVEGQSALCLWAGHLPGTTLTPFHLEFVQAGEQFTASGWPKDMPTLDQNPSFLVIAEPFTTPAEVLLGDIAERFPGASAIGGMASGAQEPGANRLLFNETVVDAGVVGGAVTGAGGIGTVGSRGCRPIADRFSVPPATRTGT